jgi:hypothetical protein
LKIYMSVSKMFMKMITLKIFGIRIFVLKIICRMNTQKPDSETTGIKLTFPTVPARRVRGQQVHLILTSKMFYEVKNVYICTYI